MTLKLLTSCTPSHTSEAPRPSRRRILPLPTESFALAALALAVPCQAQCPDETIHGQTGPLYAMTFHTASCAFDPDGPGGETTKALIAGTYTAYFDVYRQAAIDQFDKTQWKSFYNSPTSIDSFDSMCQWDPDGDGAAPAVLVVGVRNYSNLGAQVISLKPRAALGESFDSSVEVVFAWDNDQNPATPSMLLAGGRFRNYNGAPMPSIAVWDGTTWHPFGGGVDGNVIAITTWDPDAAGPLEERLVVAGNFLHAGGIAGTGPGSIAATGVAAWNGQTWEPFAIDIGERYYPGVFDGSPSVVSIASWDEDGPGPANPRLAISGFFWNNRNTAQRSLVIADFNSETWPSDVTPQTITLVTPVDHDGDAQTPDLLAVGGPPSVVASIPAAVVVWDGTQFQALGAPNPLVIGNGAVNNAFVLPADEFAPRRHVFAGTFLSVNGYQERYAMAWDGHRWSRLGSGYSPLPNTAPRQFVTWDPDGPGPSVTEIWAVGVEGLTDHGQTLRGVSRYDGAGWLPTGADMFTRANTVALFDPDGPGPDSARPVVGGIETSPDATTANSVRLFDGHAWIPLGDGLAHEPLDLCTWETLVNAQPVTLLVSVGPGNTPGQYLYNGQWRPIAVPTGASPRAVAQIDFDGAGADLPLLAIASHATDRSNVVRVYADPQSSRSISHDFRGNPATAATNAGPNLSDDMFQWDPDGPEPLPPGLVIASSSVYSEAGTREHGLNLLKADGTRVSLGSDIYYIPASDITHAAVWYEPNDPVPYIAWSSTNVLGVWRNGGVSYGYLAATGPVGPWDPDGNGPRNRELTQLGPWMDSFRGQFYSTGVTQHKASPRPWIARAPVNSAAGQGDTIQLTATPAWGYAERDQGLQFKWRRNGITIGEGAGGASPGGGTVSGAAGTLLGTRDLVLTISGARRSDTGYYDLVVTNSCGTASSAAAEIYVEPACPADIDDSGALNELDIARFLSSYEIGHAEADLDRSGGVDASDLAAFFDSYASGCP